MRRIFTLLSLMVGLAAVGQALAQEPVGCDKFKWPIDKERALLATAKPLPSGGEVA
jgi:hypothetical protein